MGDVLTCVFPEDDDMNRRLGATGSLVNRRGEVKLTCLCRGQARPDKLCARIYRPASLAGNDQS